MYKIAVCENEPQILTDITALVSSSLHEMHIEGVAESFLCCEDLLEAFEQDSHAFDLVLLDILMDGMNGMELAKTLRNMMIQVAIVFLTGSEAFLKEGYTVQPISYLFKPLQKEKLLEVIRIARQRSKSRTVIFHNSQSNIVLELSEIVYLEIIDHKLHIRVTGEEEMVIAAGSLTSAMESLPSDLFVRCHNSFLVNLAYVKELIRSGVVLRGGYSVPVSRKYYENTQVALVNFLSY